MLQAINDRIKGWLGIAIVILIGLPFALWGIQSYVGGGSELYAAKVNNIEISERELEFNLSQQRQKLMQQYGGRIPFEDQFLKKQVLDQLVNRKLVESSTYEAGYRVSDAELSDGIRQIFSREGEFDRELLERVLQSRGQTISQFEYELRSDMRVAQMRAGLMITAFVTDDEIRRLVELEDQGREASLIKFDVNDYQQGVTISEDEIQNEYEAQAARYMLPEKVSIEYVELKNEQLAADVQVDEQRLEQMYADYVSDISRREKRKASHILVKTGSNRAAAMKELEEIRRQLDSGASFADLAKQYSQDTGSAEQGGDLGWIEPGQMVKPFEDALFELEKGEISQIVESEFGLHLIKLVDIEKETAATFEEKRAELEQALRQEAVGNIFYDLSETMATTAFENPDSLDAVVDVMETSLKTSELFTRESGNGIAANDKVRNAAFSKTVLQDGNNSDVIEVAPGHVIVLRVHKHEPASLRPLEEVRLFIENTLRRQKGHQLALEAAKAAATRIESGDSFGSVAAGKVVDKPGMLTRKDVNKIDPLVLDAIFRMPRPDAGKVAVTDVPMNSGDVMLVVLEKVVSPEKIGQERIDSMRAQLKQVVASQDFNAALLSLRESADIYLNKRIFDK